MIPEKAADTFTLSGHPDRKEITLLTVKGCLDTNTAPDFEKIFQSALNQKKFKLVVDLKDAEYISSAGWGIFVSELKRIRRSSKVPSNTAACSCASMCSIVVKTVGGD